MKCFALLALTSTALLAQSPEPTLPNGPLPPPEKTPSPAPALSAAPAATPAPAPSPETKNPVDLLSADDVKQAISLIKQRYVAAGQISDADFARATLQGLLERLGAGVNLLEAPDPNASASPFRSEIVRDSIGYLRLGDLTKANVDALRAALKGLADKPVKSVILDLRATAQSTAFDLAAEAVKCFCAKGQLLFTQKKSSASSEQIFTSNTDPLFQGLIIVLVDHETAGASEVMAAAWRCQAKALIVGEKTAGKGVAFSDLLLGGGKLLRVATAEIALPGLSIYPDGVTPDITIAQPDVHTILNDELTQGLMPFVTESSSHARMNEAALVAGTNPELDALEQAQRLKMQPKPTPHDAQLERALDLITTIRLYEKKATIEK